MAFSYCTSLEEVILNEGLTSIGEWVFYSTAIKQIAIPASVTYIGSMAFAICNNLTTIIYYGDSPDKIKLYTVDILQNSPNIKTLIIPNAINPDDERWKTFLGGNFTDIRKQ